MAPIVVNKSCEVALHSKVTLKFRSKLYNVLDKEIKVLPYFPISLR